MKFRHSNYGSRYENSYFSRFGEKGSENGQFDCPQGLVISKSNFIFICDKNNHRIQVYSIPKNGEEEFSFSIGQFGNAPGSLNHPTDLSLNRTKDKLYVADTNNHRVQLFSFFGQFITCFPHQYDSSLLLNRLQFPIGICCGMDGRILVSCKHKVLVFEEDGTLVTTIKLYNKDPTGIVVRDSGSMAIAFAQNGQIAWHLHNYM